MHIAPLQRGCGAHITSLSQVKPFDQSSPMPTVTRDKTDSDGPNPMQLACARSNSLAVQRRSGGRKVSNDVWAGCNPGHHPHRATDAYHPVRSLSPGRIRSGSAAGSWGRRWRDWGTDATIEQLYCCASASNTSEIPAEKTTKQTANLIKQARAEARARNQPAMCTAVPCSSLHLPQP